MDESYETLHSMQGSTRDKNVKLLTGKVNNFINGTAHEHVRPKHKAHKLDIGDYGLTTL